MFGFEDVNEAVKIAFSKLNRGAIKEGSRITQRNTVYAGLEEWFNGELSL